MEVRLLSQRTKARVETESVDRKWLEEATLNAGVSRDVFNRLAEAIRGRIPAYIRARSRNEIGSAVMGLVQLTGQEVAKFHPDVQNYLSPTRSENVIQIQPFYSGTTEYAGADWTSWLIVEYEEVPDATDGYEVNEKLWVLSLTNEFETLRELTAPYAGRPIIPQFYVGSRHDFTAEMITDVMNAQGFVAPQDAAEEIAHWVANIKNEAWQIYRFGYLDLPRTFSENVKLTNGGSNLLVKVSVVGPVVAFYFCYAYTLKWPIRERDHDDILNQIRHMLTLINLGNERHDISVRNLFPVEYDTASESELDDFVSIFTLNRNPKRRWQLSTDQYSGVGDLDKRATISLGYDGDTKTLTVAFVPSGEPIFQSVEGIVKQCIGDAMGEINHCNELMRLSTVTSTFDRIHGIIAPPMDRVTQKIDDTNPAVQPEESELPEGSIDPEVALREEDNPTSVSECERHDEPGAFSLACSGAEMISKYLQSAGALNYPKISGMPATRECIWNNCEGKFDALQDVLAAQMPELHKKTQKQFAEWVRRRFFEVDKELEKPGTLKYYQFIYDPRYIYNEKPIVFANDLNWDKVRAPGYLLESGYRSVKFDKVIIEWALYAIRYKTEPLTPAHWLEGWTSTQHSDVYDAIKFIQKVLRHHYMLDEAVFDIISLKDIRRFIASEFWEKRVQLKNAERCVIIALVPAEELGIHGAPEGMKFIHLSCRAVPPAAIKDGVRVSSVSPGQHDILVLQQTTVGTKVSFDVMQRITL